MNFNLKKILVFSFMGNILSSSVLAMPQIGQKLPLIELSEDQGGRTDGKKWSSAMIKDHVWLFFYVDPDHKDDNFELENVLKKEAFPDKSFGTIAMINMAATWLPDVILKQALKDKQETYPRVIYVLDRKKILVERWKLLDDGYNVLVLNHDGEILVAKTGTLGPADITEVVETIRKNLQDIQVRAEEPAKERRP